MDKGQWACGHGEGYASQFPSLDVARACALSPLLSFPLQLPHPASLWEMGDERLDLAVLPICALGLGGHPQKASRNLTYICLVP